MSIFASENRLQYMKYLSLLFLFIFSVQFANAQKRQIIKLKSKEEIKIENRNFYIKKIEDKRKDVDKIGLVHDAETNQERVAVLRTDLANTLNDYFNEVLPDKKKQIPITLKVQTFEIWDSINKLPQVAGIHLKVEFYYKDVFLWNFSESVTTTGTEALELHQNNIKEVLEMAIRDFASSDWELKTNLPINENEDIYIPTYRADDLPVGSDPRRRDIVAIGYQIGGFTLIGIDYELRLTDYLGLHLGFGFRGYTGGVKVHVGKKKNSPFFNISYKDGGFGDIRVAALEFGGRLPLSKKRDFGLHGQLGVGSILYLDDTLSQKLYQRTTPSGTLTLTLGVGFSW